MQRTAVVLTAILMVALQSTLAQIPNDNPEQGFGLSPFLGESTLIPDAYSLRVSAAFPPYERGATFGYGSVSIGLSGLLEATVSREGAIGSPTGMLKPTNLLGLRLQVLPQREQFPAVSVFLTTMTGAQSELMTNVDLERERLTLFQRGLRMISYDAKTTVAGIAVASGLAGMVSYRAALGVREMIWRQQWSIYGFGTGLPTSQDGWTLPLAERTSLRVDWSASIAFRPIQQAALFAEVASLPLIDVDPSSLQIENRQGYVGAIGVRYYLPIPLSIDLYDRWVSGIGERKARHQVRLGLSTDVLFR
jgi:hypothetical protein